MAVMVASAAGALSQLLLLRISKSQPNRELTQRRLTKVDEPLHVTQTGTQERTLKRLLKRGDETARMGPASKRITKSQRHGLYILDLTHHHRAAITDQAEALDYAAGSVRTPSPQRLTI